MITASVLTVLISLFGYLIGGIAGKVAKKVFPNHFDHLFIFSGGLLIGILTFNLIPESLVQGPQSGILIGVLTGFIFMIFMESLLHKNEGNHKEKQRQFMKSIVFLAIAISLHNIPTGIAIGTSLTNSPELANTLTLTLLLHHVPEGMAIMIALFKRDHFHKFMMIGLILSLFVGIGTLFGNWVGTGGDTTKLNTILIGAAIGSIWFVTFNEILFREKMKISFLGFILIVATGILTSGFYFLFV